SSCDRRRAAPSAPPRPRCSSSSWLSPRRRSARCGATFSPSSAAPSHSLRGGGAGFHRARALLLADQRLDPRNLPARLAQLERVVDLAERLLHPELEDLLRELALAVLEL